MADVLNRITKEIRRSVHEPDYSHVEWIVNPDLSAVLGFPPDEWIIEGDVVRRAVGSEMDAILAARLAVEKERRIVEIDARSAYLMTLGASVNGVFVSCVSTAVTNLLSIRESVRSGWMQWPIPISTIDGGEHVIDGEEEFERVSKIVLARVKYLLDSGRAIRKTIKEATNIEALNAIVDSRT